MAWNASRREEPHDDSLWRSDPGDRDRQQQRSERDWHEEQVVGEWHLDTDSPAQQVRLKNTQDLDEEREQRDPGERTTVAAVLADGVGQPGEAPADAGRPDCLRAGARSRRDRPTASRY